MEVKEINKAVVYDVDGVNLFGGKGADSALETIRKKKLFKEHTAFQHDWTLKSLTNSLCNCDM